MKKNPSEDILPALAMRLEEMNSGPILDFESMSAEQLDVYCNAHGICISPKGQRRFDSILEGVLGKIRLEDAEVKLVARQNTLSALDALKRTIAAMPLAEVLRELKGRMSVPGMAAEVYARNLEQTTEEDLRTLLLDLERGRLNEGTEQDKGAGERP